MKYLKTADEYEDMALAHTIALRNGVDVREKVFVPEFKPVVGGIEVDDSEAAGTTPWASGQSVKAGDLRTFSGRTFMCLQGHRTQSDWTPSVVPALWVKLLDSLEEGETPAWEAGIAVTVGEEYTYNGQTYVVVQSHTTQAGWTPPAVPALWRVA